MHFCIFIISCLSITSVSSGLLISNRFLVRPKIVSKFKIKDHDNTNNIIHQPRTISEFIKHSGAFVGIPMTLLSSIFTYNHFHSSIINEKLIFFNFLVGLYTYGNDHLLDAINAYNKPEVMIPTKKEAMYFHLISNKELYKRIYTLCYDACLLLLFEEHLAIGLHSVWFLFVYELIKFTGRLQHSFLGFILGTQSAIRVAAIYSLGGWLMWESHWFDHDFLVLPFLIALDSTEKYRTWKVIHPMWKPAYVASMWTMLMFVLPCVIHDGTYDEVFSWGIASPFLLMYGASTMLDVADREEDYVLGVQTLPVIYGETIGQLVGIVCYMGSLWAFTIDRGSG